MTEHRSPHPHHRYDEATNLEAFTVTRAGNILATTVYLDDLTPIPTEGEIAEFHLLGTSVQGLVYRTSLMHVGDEVQLLIQAQRMQA
jgi:hypothetical protein